MNTLYGLVSFTLTVLPTFTYLRDIYAGRAKPARSTRILLFLLMLVTLFSQNSVCTSWVLALIFGQVVSQLILLICSFRYGVGGVTRLDYCCYLSFAFSLFLYLFLNNAVLSLCFLIFTDFIAFIPTIVKNWRDPATDTAFFYIVEGIIAPVFSIAARDTNSFVEILFPGYLVIVNLIIILPLFIYPKKSLNFLSSF